MHAQENTHMTTPKKTYINLPVADLPRTIAFYTAVGFTFNPQFTNETATGMIINDTTYAMLLTHERFKEFSNTPIPDPHTSTGLMLAVEFENRDEVDAFATKALANGGGEPRPAQDHGFMYSRTISDPDGHRWEPFHMDISKMPKS
jgi:uncharacterized protein